jgi:hypothetical protein
MASPSGAHDDRAAEACLEGTSSSTGSGYPRRNGVGVPRAGSQRAAQQRFRSSGLRYGHQLARAGSRTVNVAPAPGRDATSIRPPCSLTMRSAMARPSPVPPLPFVVK